jgi:hypothetical protein
MAGVVTLAVCAMTGFASLRVNPEEAAVRAAVDHYLQAHATGDGVSMADENVPLLAEIMSHLTGTSRLRQGLLWFATAAGLSGGGGAILLGGELQ